VDDLDELRDAIDAFTARLRLDPVREFYSRALDGRPPADVADGYLRSAIARLHAPHVLLFDLGQVDRPPTRRVTAGSWVDRLGPPGAPPKMRAVIERYLCLRLNANLDRPQTVRPARDALRRLVTWMGEAHPEIASLADLHREHAEEFLRWLGTQTNQQTGAPLSISFRRTAVTLITRFVTETGAVHPRRHPEDSQAAAPVHPRPRAGQADDRGRAVAPPVSAGGADRGPVERRSPRRDPRLAVDCLHTYPDGHPRLRIPVGKAYAERMIPLHPQAADALQPLIDLARQQGGRRRYDPSAGREVQHIFVVRGKLLSKSLLFDLALAEACTAAGLVDSAGKATITAHRFRHTIGTQLAQLAEGGARIQTSMAVLDKRRRTCRLSTRSLSDPTVKQQYQDALDRHLEADVTLAGPAADALREHRLDPEAVSWLQTNFLKTELELGHCLRTPAEGPCECDLVLTCSKFLTTSDYAPQPSCAH
jgi:site-specific recombinase XerD